MAVTEMGWTTLGRAGDARVEQAGEATAPRWRVGSERGTMLLRWEQGAGLRLAELAGGGISWRGDGESPSFVLRLDPGDEPGGAGAPRLIEATTDEEAVPAAVTLSVRMELGGHRVGVHVQAHDGLAALQQWLTVEAGAPAVVREVAPLALGVALPGVPILATVSGAQGQGGGRGAEGTYRSFRLERRALTEPVRLEPGPRSTWDETPWFALGGADGGVFGGLEYSASWRLDAGFDAGRGAATAALRTERLAPELAPGETWTSPAAFVGVYAGDLDGAAAAQHDFYRRVLAPPPPDRERFPWVQYNTWFSYLCDLDTPTLTRQVEIAADLGVELFYVDAGWWAANPGPRGGRAEDFTTGLGTWRENRDKFPDGLAGFGNLVRAKGMHFGLWVEPERVDLRTAASATWRTEWLAANGGRPVLAEWPPDTDAGWLCFGYPEVQEWALGWISELVERNGLRWLKWDSNTWGVCDRAGHGHGPGDGEAAQVAGVHAVLRRLRERFPELVIENCAGGGTRMDFAMARESHVHWVNDASTPGHRVRAHIAGATYLMPPAVLNAWLVESPFENMQGEAPPEPALRAMVRSRMLNAFGISCRMDGWSEETRRIVREEIAAYKGYRHLLREGYVAHLLPQPDLLSPRLGTPTAWEAFQFRSGDAAEAIVLAFRNAALEDEIALPLRGLDPSASFRVTDEFGTAIETSGTELLGAGVRVALPPLASARYRIERIADGGA